MWIVRIALSRPYTFIVLALMILVFGMLTIAQTPKDIFPNIGIPVVSTIWNYTGLPPDEMASRITAMSERAQTATVNDIEHIESQSLPGVSVVKTFFQPSASVDIALSQITAIGQTILKQAPPGTTPPLVLSYNASSVPILQLALSSAQLSEQELYDYGNNFIRTQLATVQGAAMPFPYGGKTRQILVDVDTTALHANGLSASDINTAVGNQNLILPAGTEKIGSYEYNIKLNASPKTIAEFNDLPVKSDHGSTLYLRDVAHVRDGFAPQTNIVHVNGQRALLMTVLKTGAASTLDVISRIKETMPMVRKGLPDTLDVQLIGDQSLFVQSAIDGVVREGIIAAALTACMILLFLGSWRSTLIITLSIPLSVLASLMILAALGQTINIMTLGGLALAVGILVDDATVAIENINWHLEHGKAVEDAILDGAQQIAIPALVSTLCICIVFIPMFLLGGIARYLFVPMAEAVIFAMLASYFLSRTLVPTMAKYMLRPHTGESELHGIFARVYNGFNDGFEKLRLSYTQRLTAVLKHPKRTAILFIGFILLSVGGLWPWLGSDFFPLVDAGQIKLHVRAPSGTRAEETAALCDHIDQIIRDVIRPSDVHRIIDNIGLPISGINLSYSNSAPTGSQDADILISLEADHLPTADYIRALRQRLSVAMPDVEFSFLPADIVNQILNFGLPAPIDIQVIGMKTKENRIYAQKLLEQLRQTPGIVDSRIQQAEDAPELRVTVNRSKAEKLGLTQHDVASDLLISLSGSSQTSPSFWVDPKNGVSYSVTTQVPQYNLSNLDDLRNIPFVSSDGASHILSDVATLERGVGPTVVSHYNALPVIDIFASVQDRDLGSVSRKIEKILHEIAQDLPKGSRIISRGQIQTMEASFTGLYYGLLGAIVLVYFLLVVNFQSWKDSFIIIGALPGAIAGIVWMLFLTSTRVSVPALTGVIMCMGVATANSVLLVSYARERLLHHGDNAIAAAIEAGKTRLRPVMMTALAMIIGMVPMAMGFGDGGEQNAPLGRAVIGGLLCATAATLFFVPAIFCLMHNKTIPPTSGTPDSGAHNEQHA